MAYASGKTDHATHSSATPFDEILSLEEEQERHARNAAAALEEELQETVKSLQSKKEFDIEQKKEKARKELQEYKDTILPTVLETEKRKGDDMCQSIDAYCAKHAPKVTASLADTFFSSSFLSQN